MIRRLAGVSLCLAVASQVHAQQTPAAPATFVAGRLAPGTYTYLALSQGNVFDSISVRISRVSAPGPAVRIVNFTSDPVNGDLDTVTFDARTMMPLHVFVRSGAAKSVGVNFQGNHATGHVHAASNGQVRDVQVDTTLSDGTLDDNEALFALVALPLARGASWQLPVWSWADGKLTTMGASVTGDTTLTVPAGTFPCWRVLLSGSQIGDLAVYITKAAPFAIVRYEPTAIPMAFVLKRRDP